VLLIFIFLGGYTFANDVAIIETEMVQTALWVEENTPEDAIVAVHDIGAIGYFTNRQIIDLAGLITPEVVPIIREEALLEAYLNKNNIDYLIIFPGWYPYLSSKGVEIYTTKSFHSLRAGGQNMTVYSWDKR
jgi:hypothetical protein